MLSTLIETKCHNPNPVGHLTPRLNDVLDESIKRGCQLVMITKPDGYGISTLVSEWLSKRGVRFVWFSLDSGDNEISSWPIRS